MGQMAWLVVTLISVAIMGVALITAIGSMGRWIYTSLVSEFQSALKNAAGLAAEDARLAKDHRELMQSFTATTLEGPWATGATEPLLLQCKRIFADRTSMHVVFEDMPVDRVTTFRGMRIFYRGQDVTDHRFSGGDVNVNPGDTLKFTYNLAREQFVSKHKHANLTSSMDPMFDPTLDAGQPKSEDLS